MSVPHKLEPSRFSADQLWAMLENVTSGSFYWDTKTDHVEWSPRLLQSIGFDQSDGATRVQVDERLHPEDVERNQAIIARAFETSESFTDRIRMRDADEVYRYFDVFGYWIGPDEEPTRECLGFAVDVSELARLRGEAERSERLFKAFFDNAPVAVYIKNNDRSYVYGNEFAASLAGCSLSELLEKSAPDLVDVASAQKLEVTDRQVLDRGESVRWSGDLKIRTGEIRHVLDTKFPIRDPLTDERMIGGFGLDITRQHRAERALAQSQKKEALGQLVGGIAHDFNNTLAVMQGNAELMDMLDDPDEIEICKREMRSAIERGRRLTQQLLAYGRKAVLRPQVLNLNDVLSDLDNLLRRTLPETIRIETVAGGGLWNTQIDRTEVENAVLNLALNARDAMSRGGCLTLETSNVRIGADYVLERSEEIAPGRYVMLAVSDQGEGMTPEIADKAFDPFFTTKEVNQGTGMGLAMVYGLMRQIGGTVRLYSEIGVGTTMKLFFPASRSDVEASPAPPRALQHGNQHLLLAEDEERLRCTLRRQLEQLGYRVTEAATGDAAIRIVESDPSVDLLITDIVMPGHLQGPALARAARSLRPDFPVLFMSGYPLEAAINGNGLRPDDVNLMKPVALTDLAAAIRRLIDPDP